MLPKPPSMLLQMKFSVTEAVALPTLPHSWLIAALATAIALFSSLLFDVLNAEDANTIAPNARTENNFFIVK
jgi:hypothetical protein